MIRKQPVNVLSRKSGVLREVAILPSGQPLRGANPKCPIPPGEQAHNTNYRKAHRCRVSSSEMRFGHNAGILLLFISCEGPAASPFRVGSMRPFWVLPATRCGEIMRYVPALGFLFLVSLSPVLRVQSTNASLAGRVTDPSKAATSDAKQPA
jgi:hypothetical protein